jgi:hypothetical protein
VASLAGCYVNRLQKRRAEIYNAILVKRVKAIKLAEEWQFNMMIALRRRKVKIGCRYSKEEECTCSCFAAICRDTISKLKRSRSDYVGKPKYLH